MGGGVLVSGFGVSELRVGREMVDLMGVEVWMVWDEKV